MFQDILIVYLFGFAITILLVREKHVTEEGTDWAGLAKEAASWPYTLIMHLFSKFKKKS